MVPFKSLTTAKNIMKVQKGIPVPLFQGTGRCKNLCQPPCANTGPGDMSCAV